MDADRELRLRFEKEGTPFKRACCQDLNNLRYAVDMNNRKDIVVLKCKHCGCLHRRLWVERPSWDVKGTNMGKRG